MRDLLSIVCSRGPQKAFTYVLDAKHFFREITRHEDKLTCQNAYFKHYAEMCPELLKKPDDLAEEQVIGQCFVHPTADIHPSAVVSTLIGDCGSWARM